MNKTTCWCVQILGGMRDEPGVGVGGWGGAGGWSDCLFSAAVPLQVRAGRCKLSENSWDTCVCGGKRWRWRKHDKVIILCLVWLTNLVFLTQIHLSVYTQNPITNKPILHCFIIVMVCRLSKQVKRRIGRNNSLREEHFHYWEVIMQAQSSDQSIINILVFHVLSMHLN